jgi:hypothetical protein
MFVAVDVCEDEEVDKYGVPVADAEVVLSVLPEVPPVVPVPDIGGVLVVMCDVLDVLGGRVNVFWIDEDRAADELLEEATATNDAGSRCPQFAFSLALQAACALASFALLVIHCWKVNSQMNVGTVFV